MKKTIAAKHGKVVVSVSVLRVGATQHLRFIAVKIKAALPDIREKCSETRKVVIPCPFSGLPEQHLRFTAIIIRNRVKITYPLRSSAL